MMPMSAVCLNCWIWLKAVKLTGWQLISRQNDSLQHIKGFLKRVTECCPFLLTLRNGLDQSLTTYVQAQRVASIPAGFDGCWHLFPVRMLFCHSDHGGDRQPEQEYHVRQSDPCTGIRGLQKMCSDCKACF